MTDAIKALRAWQERVRGQAPFVVPEYEDFARMVEGMEKDVDTIEALQAENHRLAMCLASDASRAVGVMLSCEPNPVDPRGYVRRVHGLVQDGGRKLQRAIAEALTTQEKPE